jgi:hypothetical protein
MANESLGAGDDNIEVHYSTASDRAPHFPEEKKRPKMFKYRGDDRPSWASSFYRSLSKVDGVVLMGGGETTYVAGTVALMHKKPVMAIATFGGSAEQIWRELTREPGILEEDEWQEMAIPSWSPQRADTLVKNALAQMRRLREREKREHAAMRGHRAINHVYVAVPLLLASLSPIPFTWDNPNLPKWFVLMLVLFSPLLAGISGATARTAYEAIGNRLSQDPANLAMTAGLGAIAGGVAATLFVITQLVAISPEVNDPIFSKQAGRLVFFAAIIGFIGGLTLDAVFRKLSGMNVISDETLKTLMDGRGPDQTSLRKTKP